MSRKKDGAEDIGELTFEDAMKRLERIVSELEAGSVSLADSLQKFEEGIALGRRCRELLASADLRVRTLVEGAEGTLVEGESFDAE
ncbi:MAG: exodeoxyribonuclease VII small subunit [Candidatus Krumholzibacteria bacterium]|nr:exodeoxyribonuclease VII small subunit [Candidatus Krumholzibacteria bacterium]MDH4336451.1 exodeoxyribonuclease VII small subunit [Candidatus Krumholzibacteria bacterium]MDH5269043.1 exodeoxyribonuclease VII small subunit [Candidatus Krumholzibacteria bacterium]MDH5627089.1 exodeoxyribonuclease VII small subunit [Candidatus Krumholzibacteria bacterium]